MTIAGFQRALEPAIGVLRHHKNNLRPEDTQASIAF